MELQKKTKSWVVKVITDFIANSPLNTLQNESNDKAWGKPLVGFSSGSDPLYDEFKRHIGDFYWKPLDIFVQTFPETDVTASELTVISWILPQTAETKRDNRREDRFPSERWARARIFGEQVNGELRRHLIASLQEAGHEAMAPELSPLKNIAISPRYGRSSNWSERHAAFASGLGTFGLCDGLITAAGKAMRCGSVIARITIPPTARPYTDHHAYCLHYQQEKCDVCIKRCPADAISAEGGHDKEKCSAYLRPITRDYVKSSFGFEGYGCGLCQTHVPCESRIPIKYRPQR